MVRDGGCDGNLMVRSGCVGGGGGCGGLLEVVEGREGERERARLPTVEEAGRWGRAHLVSVSCDASRHG